MAQAKTEAPKAQAPKTKDTKPAAKPTDERELIRDLAGLLDETNLTEIEVERAGLRVRVVRSAGMVAAPMQFAAAPVAAAATAADGANCIKCHTDEATLQKLAKAEAPKETLSEGEG